MTTFRGDQLIKENDILVIFNFDKLTKEEHLLKSAEESYYIDEISGKKYSTINDFALKEGIGYEKAESVLTEKKRKTNSLFFYDKDGKSYLGAMNRTVFDTPIIFQSKNKRKTTIAILKKNPDHAKVLEIFTNLKNKELGIDEDGNLDKYEKGRNRKLSKSKFLELINTKDTSN